MKRKLFLVALLFVAMFAIPSSVMGADRIYINKTVPASNWAYVDLGYAYMLKHYYCELDITSHDVLIFIVDSSGYTDLVNSGSTTDVIINYGEHLGSFSFDFEVTKDEHYYLIFSNYDTLINASNVSGWIEYDNVAPSVTFLYITSAIYVDEEFELEVRFSDEFSLNSYSVSVDGLGQIIDNAPLTGLLVDEIIRITIHYAGSPEVRVTIVDDSANSNVWHYALSVLNPIPTTTTTMPSTSTTTISTTTRTTTHPNPVGGDDNLILVGGLAITGIVIVGGAFAFSRTRTKTTAPVENGAKVLILCPYCGKKYEQGLERCPNCTA